MSRHILNIEDIQERGGATRDGVTYIDARGGNYDFRDTGDLYVMQPFPWVDFCPFMPAKSGDIGRDLPARVLGMKDCEDTVKLYPHRDYLINWEQGWFDIPSQGWAEIPSGVFVKVPEDAWGLIKPRSSTGWRKKLYVFEGTIDMYVGQLCCLVHNPHREPVRVHDGDKLAQFILIPRYKHERQVFVDSLPETVRGKSGFGSTDGPAK